MLACSMIEDTSDTYKLLGGPGPGPGPKLIISLDFLPNRYETEKEFFEKEIHKWENSISEACRRVIDDHNKKNTCDCSRSIRLSPVMHSSSKEDGTLIGLLGAHDNLGDPVPSWNKKPTIFGVIITFMTVSILCNSFRLYARFFIVKCPWWDDFFVVLFMLSGATGSIFILLLTEYGLGQHFLLIGEANMANYLRTFWVANATYAQSTCFIKLSLLFQYLRVFPKHSIMRTITKAMAIIIGLWGIAFTFISWFPCFPVAAYWDLTLPANCYAFGSRYADEFVAIYECHSGFNMIFDMIVLAIPVPLYFENGTTRQTRMGLLGLFLMGTIINVFGIWRLATIVEHRATTYPTFDPSWYAPVSVVQACLEVDAASICASIPVFWPVLTKKLDKIFVTHEVTISHRRLSELGEGLGYIDDDVELQRSGRESASSFLQNAGVMGNMHSREGSEASLNGIPHISCFAQGNSSHYDDTYVQDQKESRWMGLVSNVSVGSMPGNLKE